jgi:predicted dinucleotide-binding enzyme
MNTPIEYLIVAVPFHADAATHDELARKVNEKIAIDYEPLGAPFLGEEMMYQAMTKVAKPPIQ